MEKCDVFICHASEDKKAIVGPLERALNAANITCWLDKERISWGDSIPAKINEGLIQSRFVLVVASTAFVKKAYATGELDAALHQQLSDGSKRVLLLLVGDRAKLEPFLKGNLFLSTLAYIEWEGDPGHVVKKLLPIVRGKTAPPRVCFVSSEYPPRVLGGLGVHVDHLTRALAAFTQIDVVLPTPGGEEYRSQHPHIEVQPLSRTEASYDDPTSWLSFSNHAAHRIALLPRPSIIHCHDWVTVLAGIKCRWSLGIPVLFHLHLPNQNDLCASIENLGLMCADLVTVNSSDMLEEVTDRGLPLRQRPRVVKNGVDLDLFKPADDWPCDDGYILFVGRLVQQKGVEHLIRAFAYVLEKFPDVRLRIAGSGELREGLELLCQTLLVANRVEFPGWKTGDELVRLYQRARVVAIPSIYEPFGMIALEALGCKRPVVASRVGGLKEIVQNRRTGFLVQPEDELDLAQWLMSLLADANLRQEMGEAGRTDLVEGNYSWDHIARDFAAIYDELERTPLDFGIPREAIRFKDAITRLAVEKYRSEGAKSRKELDELFDWMPASGRSAKSKSSKRTSLGRLRRRRDG